MAAICSGVMSKVLLIRQQVNNMISSKEDYIELFDEVKSIVNEVDPVGLIGGGAPENEYESQINKIISLLKSNNTESLADDIYEIFLASFGTDMVSDRDKYKDMAAELIRNLAK